MAPLRDRVFLSLSESSAALSGKAGQTGARPFQKRDGSGESERLGQEKDSPVPLPAHPYRIIVHKSATVQFNYHVSFEGMFYSTPFTCLRKRAEVSATPTAVTIAVDGERVATHPRLRGRKGQFSAFFIFTAICLKKLDSNITKNITSSSSSRSKSVV